MFERILQERAFVRLSVGLTFILMCGLTPQLAHAYVSCFDFFSDPPGAHVYGQTGEYWGQTEEDDPVRRIFNSGNRKHSYNILLKKRGYKPTKYSWSWKHKYLDSREDEALDNCKKVVIVLDIE